ncbi:hypothetical protein Q428_09860 [Fervidicella metallireducens AeB]|uniref:Uncharacterized protein n=1 Tax=Fervidicella metallireducens AeB TaxID=1403537 RepID=A0A017RVZ2_9CLOT|nr:aspartyl-phosphate phosphatase Spo0E family protein [Fervidicella metallireducens]EYE88060.1 hypothetical protein Q428_09860 [Fervidicella metallireducens AeB]
MKSLCLKIETLKMIMDKKLEMNNYAVNEEIIKISQALDRLIVKYYENKNKQKIHRG